jgi:Metallopeptidase toxin 4
MDNIDGIPIVWDDADKLFGSLFPDGVAQGTQGFAGVQQGVEMPQYVSPFMEMDGIELGANLITNQATSQFPSTGTGQNGNVGYEYLVATIACEDGAKVYSTYESTAIEPHELYLFYEKENANKNNLFGNFYIAKIGDSFSGIIRNFLDTNNKYQIPGTIKGEAKAFQINSYDTLTGYVNQVAKKQHLDTLSFNTTHNAIEREYLSKTPTGKLYEGLNSIDEIIAKGLDWCADELEGLLINEKSYIPSDNYRPIIGQSKNSIGAENLVVDLFEEVANNGFVKEVEAAIGEAYSYIVSTLTKLGKALYDQLPEPVKNIIRKLQGLVQELKTGLDAILQYVGNFIKAVGALVLEVLQLINAFLCGIINGIISTVQAIIRILAFLVDMTGMDNDYKSYLRRRDLGEKIESVFDFITESFSLMVEGIINLFKPPYNTTAADIKRFIQSIGSFFEKAAGGVVDFFENTSRFKFAYWAGIFVFEVIINVLLAIFTAGGGNAVKAAGSFVKILGREMISVATLGVVDILAFFKSLIGAFVRACKRGLKGFLRWVEELIKGIKKGNAKSVDELLEDVERGAAFVKRGNYLGQVLEDIDIEKVKAFLKKRNVDFQIGPGNGIFEVEGYFYASGNLFKMEAKNAALFITDGRKMKLILRENATVYELLHELMHYNHCKTLGIKKYFELGKQGINGTILREKYVFDKIVENSKFLNRAELEHAELYINWNYNKVGVTDNLGNPIIEKLPFDVKDLPTKRQEIGLNKILDLLK